MRNPSLTRRELLNKTAMILSLAAIAPASWAHRSHNTLTQVSVNARSGTWEFTHVIHYLDSQLALYQLSEGKETDLSKKKSQVRIALEIENKIQWFKPSGEALKLITIGTEVTGDNLLIYQEISAPHDRGLYVVISHLLHDIFNDQSNTFSLQITKKLNVIELNKLNSRAEFIF